jgi:O-methyltransferase involved in polyketide biosynthesis
METNENLSSVPHDPSSISPSAYSLLLMKSHTSIPYAREAAALSLAIRPAETPGGEPADAHPVDYWTRVMHFESRYWSINQLLADQTPTNILELSSGFSFRGLDLSNKKPVYYLDTDLPNIITGKQKFVDAFDATAPQASAQVPAAAQAPAPSNSEAAADAAAAKPGHYELHPLNALDPEAFQTVIDKFPEGPLTIVNEGLMVYLDDTQKRQLCANIRKALLQRGGRWITADVYLKRKDREDDASKDGWQRWSREHHLEEKKFASFHDAEKFFNDVGFNVEKEAIPDYTRLTSFPQFLKATGPQALEELRRPGKPRLQATWRLKPRA